MPTYTLTIETGNDAMRLSGDLSDTLRAVANDIDWRDECDIADIPPEDIRDANGNTVGRAHVVSDPLCTGAVHDDGSVSHDGDTCPLHETRGEREANTEGDTRAFTYRNLAGCVFDSFAISTRELADTFGQPLAKVRDALSAYPGIFCGDLEECEGGVTDRRSGRRSHADGGQYGAIVWQCFKTYDDHTLAENLADLEAAGADLDATI